MKYKIDKKTFNNNKKKMSKNHFGNKRMTKKKEKHKGMKNKRM